MTVSTTSARLASLDGLRAIAIGLVIAGHSAEAYGLRDHPWWLSPAVNSSFGVRLFFVLSGFLITRLLMREEEVCGSISLKAFYMRRSLRIFPAFYLFLATIGILVAFGVIDATWQQFLGAGTYTWNYLYAWYNSGPAEGAWFLGHLWTLSLEEQFYLFWPILIVFAGWRAARFSALLLPLMLPVLRIAWYYRFPEQRGLLGMMFHTAIDSILVGCLFALYEKPLSALTRGRDSILYAALAIPLLISPISATFFRPYYVTIGFGLDAACAGFLILHAVRGGVFAYILSVAPLRLVGTWSYSLYLWQQLFLTTYNTTWSGRLPTSLICLTACAVASHYIVEKPILRLKRRFERIPIQSKAAALELTPL